MRFCPTCGLRVEDEIGFCPEDGSTTEPLEPEPTTDPLLGRVIDGRYRIEHQIGEGGMGVVYLAMHTVLNKKLALKVLRGDMSKNTETVQRFIQEAQAASAIGHQNIIDISDFGRLPDGSAYFVMEYLEGQALTDLIARGGSVPMQDAIRILMQMASALGAAHKRGIVHRDLKPDNVHLIPRGDQEYFVKVLDFGIAKVGGAGSKLTKTGMVFGTPQYMSPEQAAGQAVDLRTDIYALGVIMYEMFTGRVPFDADTFMGILSKHMFEPPAPPSEANSQLGALEDIILKALAKKPEQRYANTDELLADLKAFSVGGSISLGGENPGAMGLADALEPPSRTEANLVPKGIRPNRVPLIIGAVALLGALVVGGAALVGWGFFSASDSDHGGSGASLVARGDNPGTEPGSAPDTPSSGSDRNPMPADSGGSTDDATQAPSTTDREPSGKRVRLLSTPEGAQVYDDGVVIGNTPLEVNLESDQGARDLELRLPGHHSARVRLEPDGPQELVVPLREQHRSLQHRRPQHRRPERPSRPMVDIPAVMMVTPMMNRVPGNEVVDPWALD